MMALLTVIVETEREKGRVTNVIVIQLIINFRQAFAKPHLWLVKCVVSVLSTKLFLTSYMFNSRTRFEVFLGPIYQSLLD